jgi:hypothetical protein
MLSKRQNIGEEKKTFIAPSISGVGEAGGTMQQKT